MIYKILTSTFFSMEKLDKLSEKGFPFLLADNIIYTSIPTPRDGASDGAKKKLKRIFNNSEYLITELSSFEYESESAREWCISKTNKEKLTPSQEDLKSRLQRLDEFEEYLKTTLENGGSHDQT